MTPFISICIPSYKRADYLRRLLDSISIQEYRNFEVVISDDTPGNEVESLCSEFQGILPLKYFHNANPLGTPENWNEAIRKSTSEWIKIMHDDDWFATPESLSAFAQTIAENEACNFFFSAHRNVYEQEGDRKEEVHLSAHELKRLRKEPLLLFRKNYIGNPSCTLFRINKSILFDSTFKWVVDFEFYLRYLEANRNVFVYIDEPLVNTSLNSSQVTTSVFRDAKVEVPENHLLLAKQGLNIVKNVFVYDYYWRSYRNLKIKSMEQIKDSGYTGNVPAVLVSMISWQQKVPATLLCWGPFSKGLMFLHFLTHRYQLY